MNVESDSIVGPPAVDRVPSDGGIDTIAEELQSVAAGHEGGVFSDRIEEIEPLLLSFGSALGGDPSSLSELPFTEEAGTDGMPEPLYVRHDDEMLDQVTSWLLQRQHIGLISPLGTGKTAIREIASRDLGDRDDFVVAALSNPAETTSRGLYETVIRAGYEAGFHIDTDQYWQVSDGIPWATEETRDAVSRMAEAVEAEDVTLLLLVDEIEDLPVELLGPLQTVADAGVRLFMTGTPDGRARLRDFRDTLDSRVRYYNGIEPFSPADIEEYVARSLAYFRDETYEGQTQSLFASDAIAYIHERSGGTPRAVRLECQDLFARAAFIWDRSNVDADRIQITGALRDRSLAMGE